MSVDQSSTLGPFQAGARTVSPQKGSAESSGSAAGKAFPLRQ